MRRDRKPKPLQPRPLSADAKALLGRIELAPDLLPALSLLDRPPSAPRALCYYRDDRTGHIRVATHFGPGAVHLLYARDIAAGRASFLLRAPSCPAAQRWLRATFRSCRADVDFDQAKFAEYLIADALRAGEIFNPTSRDICALAGLPVPPVIDGSAP